MSAIKSILLKGNFTTVPVTYKLCPNTEFSEGAWNLSIHAISYQCQEANFVSQCALTCNFVRGQKYSLNETSITNYQMPLIVFSVETGSRTINTGQTFKYDCLILSN